ncbi:MAG: signal peptidase I [Actinobacteria bacterium]|nr:signal peptidase I [Actinomycetota bacterium]
MSLKSKKSVFKEFLGYFIVAIIAAVFSITLRIFVIEPYIVPTPSMAPTLLIGDKVIVNKLEYKVKTVKRGDIIAVYSPIEKKNLTKRVIGLENEEIKLTGDGSVYINGELLDEPYLPEDAAFAYEEKTYKTGDNQYFLMGDNRNNSSDSRVFGPVDLSKIFGKVIFIYGPISRISNPYR